MEMVVNPLSESVRNSLRSGIILYDLTRVVEELLFNSLDASATKVSVYVGVGTCYVKVVDDGFGVSRDGLELLGERYVTSKLHQSINKDGAANGFFGFRGEALASISEVSLLEIATKTSGKPNGYHKIIKGSKCLYLGISDDRKEVGTTVIVRDLFYNQPVRRKLMQSSSKKILHSVKKCVHWIALVHPKISFKVVDVESEDVLLHTNPSSMLSRIMIGFGVEDSSFLYDLNASDGALKLSGYISGPCDNLAKAFQYVYINSRFVCKGLVHKLINNLAAKFEVMDPWKGNNLYQKRKRSRSQTCPAYVLNICCPTSLYDLTFESSKIYVEFKDWIPVLTFIEDTIQQLWRGSDLTKNSKSELKCKTRIHYSSQQLAHSSNGQHSRVTSKEFDLDDLELHKDVSHAFNRKYGGAPFEEFYLDGSEFKEQEASKMVCVADLSSQSCNVSFSKQTSKVSEKSNNDLLTYHNKFFQDDDSLKDKFTTRERSSDHVEDHYLNSEWQNAYPGFESDMRNRYTSVFSLDSPEFSNELNISKNEREPSLIGRSILLDGIDPISEERFQSPIDTFKNKRRRVCVDADENLSMPIVDDCSQKFDVFPSTSWESGVSDAQLFPLVMDVDIPVDFIHPPGASVMSSSSRGNSFAKQRGFKSGSFMCTESFGSGYDLLYSKSDASSDGKFVATAWDVGHFPDDNDAIEGSSTLGKKERNWHFADGEELKYKSRYDSMQESSGHDHSIVSSSTALDFNNTIDSFRDVSKFFQGNDLCEGFSLRHSGEEDWLHENLFSRVQRQNDWNEVQGDQLGYQAWEQDHIPRTFERSHSAPPFHKCKKFISLSHHTMLQEGAPNCTEDLVPSSSTKNMPSKDKMEIQKGFVPEGTGALVDHGNKWRNRCQQIAISDAICTESQHDILNISSGFLHLAGNSLVPESLQKNFLENAKVLFQVDKKFIPVVAGGTLAVIDQHAADERIRLEELREKVLSGEAKTVTYLDDEKELIFPEMGYQLLHNYAEQIREWGWICNIQAQGSKTFKKSLNVLHQQPTMVTLLAVPCILGVNLSDGDLLEFLQQLADTDGSSTMPLCVLRVLNYKACRGAIMFGDSLLPSECGLIIEELKRTSLCFQCAHGRPTTVPLVNLERLHKQVAKLGVVNKDEDNLQHRLLRQELNLERAAKRLDAARH